VGIIAAAAAVWKRRLKRRSCWVHAWVLVRSVAKLKRPLLSVDVSVCLSVCMSANLMLNISEAIWGVRVQ